MKKLFVVAAALLLFSCVTPGANTWPDGKTQDDWYKDEWYCRQKSGYVAGFFGQTTYGLISNIDARPKYEACLREMGWIK